MAEEREQQIGSGDSVDIFAKAAADSAAGAIFGVDSAAGMTSPAGAPPAGKVCCVCGLDLKGKTRFKDADGRYWCYECGMADSMRKHPAPCPDCKRSVPQAELTEFRGVRVCKECLAKRQLAFKREQARIAAAEEEEARLQAKRRRMFVVVLLVVVLLAMYGASQLMTRLLTNP